MVAVLGGGILYRALPFMSMHVGFFLDPPTISAAEPSLFNPNSYDHLIIWIIVDIPPSKLKHRSPGYEKEYKQAHA